MNRRHALGAMLASGALALSPRLLSAAQPQVGERHYTWTGMALGADASIQIQHHDTNTAYDLLQCALHEITRLERVFSLHDPNSALCQLNQTGILHNPPADLLSLLSQSQQIFHITSGIFDPSIQNQWQYYLQRYNQLPHSLEPPQAAALLDITLEPDLIRLPSNAQLTLNGIAQGYITDQVCGLLLQHGVQRALVNAGEIRGINLPPADAPWRIGITHPVIKDKLMHVIALCNSAVATSERFATTLDPAGTHSHILLPSNPTTTPRWASVTVQHELTSWADALATAFMHMHETDIKRIAQEHNASVFLSTPSGVFYSL